MTRAFALLLLIWAGPASAQSSVTTTYTYDPLGRLTGSKVTSSSNAPIDTTITYDPAGNRTRYQVSGATGSTSGGGGQNGGGQTGGGTGGSASGSTMIIVVPLNGFTLIPVTVP